MKSIRVRLFVLALSGIAIALGATAFGLTALFGRHVERRIGQELDAYVSQIAGNLRVDATGGLTLAREPADARFHQPFAGLYWQVVDERSGALTRSRSLWDAQLPVARAAVRSGETRVETVTGPADEDLLLHERRVILTDGGADRPVLIGVAVDRSELEPLMSGFAWDMLPGLAILGAFLLGGAWWQVGAGLRPLRALSAGVSAVREGAAGRVPGAVPDEVAPLVTGINDLLDQRDQMVVRARDRAADLAHAMKTPLTALAGDVGRLRARGDDALADDIAAVASQMRRAIDRELARSRLRHTGYGAGSARVLPVAESVARTLGRTAAGEALAYDLRIGGDVAARMPVDDLTEVLGNLMENAARVARSRVRVSGDADGAGGATIRVEDDGPGADPETMVGLSGRGRRADESGGAGLGLAIVGDILSAHGTSLAFGRSDLGGLAVSFIVPA
ncbi:MAG: HAMP domain-containing histidine kinase [Rhizobiaceae bacterium]|nr:HAMP domain-containing histidine kinase [Rhizobiaceae bacterium]